MLGFFFLSCFIKPVEPEIFFFSPPSPSLSLSLSSFSFSNHQSVSDSFPDQSGDGKGCCVPEVSWQLTRQSQSTSSSPPPHPLFMSKGGEGRGANVNGRSDVNYLYASLSGAEQTRDWRLPAPSSRQITMKFSDQIRSFRGLNRQHRKKN